MVGTGVASDLDALRGQRSRLAHYPLDPSNRIRPGLRARRRVTAPRTRDATERSTNERRRRPTGRHRCSKSGCPAGAPPSWARGREPGETSRITVSLGAGATVTTSSYRAPVMIVSWRNSKTRTEFKMTTNGLDVSRPAVVPLRECLANKPISVTTTQLRTSCRRPDRDEKQPGYRSGLSLDLIRPSPHRSHDMCGYPHDLRAANLKGCFRYPCAPISRNTSRSTGFRCNVSDVGDRICK